MAAGAGTGDGSGPLERFFGALERALATRELARLVLSKPTAAAGDLARIDGRLVTLKGEAVLQLVLHHSTRDVTQNVALDAAAALVRSWCGANFQRLHLAVPGEELQLMRSKRGQFGLSVSRTKGALQGAQQGAHDRPKRRRVDTDASYLRALGVTDARGAVVPAMARKYRQIEKFVEVVDGALAEAGLAAPGRPVRIADFGCGKGYLTFALHEHLRNVRGLAVETVGVELRPELVELCNDVAARAGCAGLSFVRGDLATFEAGTLDVMIALHACDTATDHALDLGLRAGASVLVCSPCCHKELRPQVQSPAPLAALLRHGVHLGQEAEMLTDTVRALLVEGEGYDAKVFEFVALEHTSKNKMLLATRRAEAADDAPPQSVWRAERRAARRREAAALLAHFEVTTQRLFELLRAR